MAVCDSKPQMSAAKENEELSLKDRENTEITGEDSEVEEMPFGSVIEE